MLRHNLLRGVWYDHAQPPFFNLLLGIVLKNSGSYSPVVFAVILKAISLFNGLLLYAILKHLKQDSYIPVLISLTYILSPALMIFESGLFYTTFISMLLLISVFFLLRLEENRSPGNASGFFLPPVVLCLTCSMFHLIWLAATCAVILFYFRKGSGFKGLSAGFILSCCRWAAGMYRE